MAIDLKFIVYQVLTPKTHIKENKTYDKPFDNVFLYGLMQELLKTKNNIYKENNIFIELENVTDEENIILGHFITAKYGEKIDILDVDSNKISNTLNINEGIREKIYFAINKENGKLYLQDDSRNKILNKSTNLRLFFNDLINTPKIRKYIDECNEQDPNFMRLFNSCVKIKDVTTNDFYYLVNHLDTRKSLSLIFNSDNPIYQEFYERFIKSDNPLENFENISIQFYTETSGESIKNIKDFIDNTVELDSIDRLKVEGYYSKANKKYFLKKQTAKERKMQVPLQTENQTRVPIYHNLTIKTDDSGNIDTSELENKLEKLAMHN